MLGFAPAKKFAEKAINVQIAKVLSGMILATINALTPIINVKRNLDGD